MFVTIAILIVAICFVAISVTVRANTELRDAISFDADIAPQLRISVVTTHGENIGHIASMLRSESIAYQVVVVNDFSSQESSLRRVMQYFGLIKVDYISSGEMPVSAVRGLYRSHRRLFNRLVVVDSPKRGNYTAFEVGAAVSSYNYCLQIYSKRSLRVRAIENLLLELSMHGDPPLFEIRSAIGEGFRLITREAALHDNSGVKTRVGKNQRKRIAYRILQ